jgi:multisubunit Na+/H+ antiporter MnhE subunit
VDDPDPRPSRPRQLRRGVTDLLVGAALWLLLAGTVDAQEVAGALLAGATAAAVGRAVRRHVGHQDVGAGRWLRHLPGWYLQALRDTAPVTRGLISRLRGRPSRSRIMRVPFEVGGLGADDSSRRALVTVGISLQPNTYVLGYDHERGVALVHQLEPVTDEPIPPSVRRSATGGDR